MMAAFAHEDRVTELLSWLGGASTATVPGPGPISVAGVAPGSSAEPWLLGSSPVSALLAGRLGLPYCFAAFVNPAAARLSLDAYRSTFQPRPGDAGPEAPRTMLAVNLCCADTDLEADRLRASVEQFYDEDQAPGTPRPPLLDPEAAVARLGAVPPPTPPDGGQWPRHLSGGPARAASLLERLVEETGADEVMVQDLIARPEDRRRSYELLARVMEPALLGAAPETPPRSTVGDPSQRAPAR
jgi:alkanesulfonate monooxygenase SsuD/methylene tetrahydromethanopterin reductase-like flavin-dependent oxidoreductase (luciferase family)